MTNPNFVNLTPHDINFIKPSGERVSFPPSGTVARVSSTAVRTPSIGEFPTARCGYGEVEGLPAPSDNTVYIVSGKVLAACSGRDDVVGPGTDPSLSPERHPEKGFVTAVRAWARPPA